MDRPPLTEIRVFLASSEKETAAERDAAQRPGAVGSGPLQRELDAAIGERMDSVVGDRRASDVPGEALEGGAVAGGDAQPSPH